MIVYLVLYSPGTDPECFQILKCFKNIDDAISFISHASDEYNIASYTIETIEVW